MAKFQPCNHADEVDGWLESYWATATFKADTNLPNPRVHLPLPPYGRLVPRPPALISDYHAQSNDEHKQDLDDTTSTTTTKKKDKRTAHFVIMQERLRYSWGRQFVTSN